MEKNIYKIGKELFITNDEEIKEGDFYFYKCGTNGLVDKATKSWKTLNREYCKKNHHNNRPKFNQGWCSKD
jgi:hypothetical protein